MPMVEATNRRTVPGGPTTRTSRSGKTPHHRELQSGLGRQRRYVAIANIRATRQGRDWTHRVLATGRTPSVDQLDLVLRRTSPDCQQRLAQPPFPTDTEWCRARLPRRLRVPHHRLVASIKLRVSRPRDLRHRAQQDGKSPDSEPTNSAALKPHPGCNTVTCK